MTYHVSVGGIKMRGWRVFIPVIRQTYLTLRAARASLGCVHADIFRDGRRYFAFSVWDDEAAMKEFAHKGVHRELMRKSDVWFTEFKNHSFKLDEIPNRAAAKAHWLGAQETSESS